MSIFIIYLTLKAASSPSSLSSSLHICGVYSLYLYSLMSFLSLHFSPFVFHFTPHVVKMLLKWTFVCACVCFCSLSLPLIQRCICFKGGVFNCGTTAALIPNCQIGRIKSMLNYLLAVPFCNVCSWMYRQLTMDHFWRVFTLITLPLRLKVWRLKGWTFGEILLLTFLPRASWDDWFSHVCTRQNLSKV